MKLSTYAHTGWYQSRHWIGCLGLIYLHQFTPTFTVAQAGIKTSDKLLTVSPNYATEMADSPSKGVELDDIIRCC